MKLILPSVCLVPLLLACKQPTPNSDEQALAFEDSLTSGSQIGLQPMEVALTLDDGPAPESLPLAKKLRDLEIPVSYFMIGVNIQSHPQVTREIAELKFTTGAMAGKPATIIANHSWDHKRKNSEIACIACDGTEYANMEITKTDALIRGYVTQANKPFFFRAPGGNFFRRDVPEEVKSLNEINKDLSKYIGPFFWDVSGDVEPVCLKESAEKCGDYYMGQIRRKGRSHGLIILAHDIHEKTRTMLLGDGKYPGIIAQMKREGFKFVHLDKYPAALSKFGNVPRNEFGEISFKANRVADKTYNFDVKVKGASKIEVFIDRLQQPLFSGAGNTLQSKQAITTGGQRIFVIKGFDASKKQIAQGSRSIDLPY
ncbi:MAG: polysaccharide deacetylase family protein [Betaproteobacteria bacterium]|nr:polysaccharide deacetylase family protein [Betaproteobacteria bacterium]